MPDFDKFKNFIASQLEADISNDGIYLSIDLFNDKKYVNIVSNDEIKSIFDASKDINHENFELYDGNSYEIGCIISEKIFYLHKKYPIIVTDSINNITYKFGYPSLEYSSFLVSMMADNFTAEKMKIILPAQLALLIYINDNKENIFSFKDIFPRMTNVFTIQINSKEYNSIEYFRNLVSSFEFQFMYKNDVSIININNVYDMYDEDINNANINFENICKCPLRIYNSNVIDYYRVAVSSNNPYTKYISFYNVIEYYYDEVFRKNIINEIRDKITSPTFSYKDDNNIYEIASFVKKRLKYNDESGQGNEKESLEYVLKEYVHIDDLKNRLKELDEESIDYYEKKRVIFCNGPIIQWKNNQDIYKNIASRIYYTRNSLIHSKSGKNDSRYRPYNDEKKLQKEIPLIRAVADLVIINSSNIL